MAPLKELNATIYVTIIEGSYDDGHDDLQILFVAVETV